MKIKHIMVDLETLGTNPYAAILSIGALYFDPQTPGVFRDSFEVMVDQESCVKAGLRIEASTNMWWWSPDLAEARQRWLDTLKFDLPLALTGFSQWLDLISEDKDGDPEHPHSDVRIWGNGANFDNVLLACAYKVANIQVPWDRWNDRCFRTIKNLGNTHDLRPKGGSLLVDGVKHTALYDCFHQAAWMQNIVADRKIEVS